MSLNDNVVKFLHSFKQVAVQEAYPKEVWVWFFAPFLSSKWQKVYLKIEKDGEIQQYVEFSK